MMYKCLKDGIKVEPHGIIVCTAGDDVRVHMFTDHLNRQPKHRQ